MPASTTFSGALLDRASERRRDEGWIGARLEDPESRAVIVAADGVLISANGDPGPAYLELTGVRAAPATQPLLLGLADGRAIFALDVDDTDLSALAPQARVASLRDAGAWLAQADGALLAYAQAIVGWHRRNSFCAVCGTRSVIREAGHVRACPNCGALHHPRMDPVVIALVTDGDRALLGRQAAWPAGRYSALAGYVEPGEALEDAVRREVREESCVEVDAVRYQASQPWPFPASLMLGFVARYAGGRAAIGDRELEDVRWFERGDLERAVTRAEPIKLPPPVAIARRLIDAFLEGPSAERVPSASPTADVDP